jgi:hypothetical protein
MNQSEVVLCVILGFGLLCSLTLFYWLARLIRRDRKQGN